MFRENHQRVGKQRSLQLGVEPLGIDKITEVGVDGEFAERIEVHTLVSDVVTDEVRCDPEQPGSRGWVPGIERGAPFEGDHHRARRYLLAGVVSYALPRIPQQGWEMTPEYLL